MPQYGTVEEEAFSFIDLNSGPDEECSKNSPLGTDCITGSAKLTKEVCSSYFSIQCHPSTLLAT